MQLSAPPKGADRQYPGQSVPRDGGCAAWSSTTHTGVPLADHVVLVWLTGGGPCGVGGGQFRRFLPDGSFENAVFTVPAGRTLVVTDLDAVIRATASFDVNSFVHASLTTPAAFTSSIVPHATNGYPVTLANQTMAAVSSSLGAGVPFGPGQQLCLRGDERPFGGYEFHEVVGGGVRGHLF